MPQFQKGQSGNPAGRPASSRNRATITVQNLLEGAAENIAKRAAQLAEEGNVAIAIGDIGEARRIMMTASSAFRGGAEHACCPPCYLPVRKAAGFAFCQPVQRGNEGSL